MKYIIKCIKLFLGFFALSFLLLTAFIIFIFAYTPKNSNGSNINGGNTIGVTPFSLSENDVTYNNKKEADNINILQNAKEISDMSREEIISRAKAMTEVKWTPKYNLIDKYGPYIFVKGKTYYGVPYTMDTYQVGSTSDFLSKINGSKILYGNDCSGFVSAAWGISRQTTLTLYEAVRTGSAIDGKAVVEIKWEELKQGDALLLDNGKGKGHIMLYIDSDKKNSDNLNVYEQNVSTVIPFEPIPAARKDVRSKKNLINEGYMAIRLMNVM